MSAPALSGQLDLLGYVAPEPSPASDQTDGILGFMQAMASIGQQPTMRDVAQYLGTDGVIDEATAAAWRHLVASGRIVGFEVPEELGALRWKLGHRATEPAVTQPTATAPDRDPYLAAGSDEAMRPR